MYLTFDEYLTMGGDEDNAAFGRLEMKAAKIVERKTFGRLRSAVIPQAVKCLMFELISALEQIEASDNREKASYSNDGVSASYRESPKNDERAALIDDMITDYLLGETAADGTPLLYLGV